MYVDGVCLRKLADLLQDIHTLILGKAITGIQLSLNGRNGA